MPDTSPLLSPASTLLHTLPSPALIRVGPAAYGAKRDTRPVYAANLRWLDSAQDRLTAAEIAQQAANHGATWKVVRPQHTDHFAIAPDVLPYDDSTPLRDRVKPAGIPSIAALLASLVEPGKSAIFVHDVTLATPLELAVWLDDTTSIPDPRRPGDTVWLVVTVIDGRIAPSDTITLAGGGDLLVTEDHATAILGDFRERYPDAAVYTVPDRKLRGRDDNTAPLESLLRDATTPKALSAHLTRHLPWAKHPVLTPVKAPSLAWTRPVFKAVLLAGAAYVAVITLPTMYREGRLPFMTPPPPPKPAYVPPPPAAVFALPLPSAWIASCLAALDDLYRPIQGYTPGQSSCLATPPAAASPTTPGMPPRPMFGGASGNATDGIPGDPPPPYGRAAIAYAPLAGAKAGHLRDIAAIFQPKAAPQNPPSSSSTPSQSAIQIQEPASLDKFTAHRSLLSPPGQTPRLRGQHALMRADDLRRHLLDLRRTACLAIVVDVPTDSQSSLLSAPGAPYATAPVARMKVTITTAMSPPNLAAFLDATPGLVLTAIKRGLDDSAKLATGDSDPSRPDTKDAKDSAAASKDGKTVGDASTAKPTVALPTVIGCDHPMIRSLATWTLEAHAYAIQ